MSAVPQEYPEADPYQQSIDCEAEIVDLCVMGKWQGFWDERHDDLNWIVRDALKQPDADAAMGTIRAEVRKLAEIYAAHYMAGPDPSKGSRDPEEVNEEINREYAR